MDYNTRIADIAQFRFWCQKVLPAVYDDSLSYYELLCKVIDKLNEVIAKDNEQSDVINLLIIELTALKEQFEKFKESGFEDYYEQQIKTWVDANMERIISYSIEQVYFGLTLDGYFIAYIPNSWDDIYFDTGADYNSDDYGRLILGYYVDSQPPTEQ